MQSFECRTPDHRGQGWGSGLAHFLSGRLNDHCGTQVGLERKDQPSISSWPCPLLVGLGGQTVSIFRLRISVGPAAASWLLRVHNIRLALAPD